MLGSSPRFLTYQVGSSVLHRLDPRTKLLGAAGIIAAGLIAGQPLAVAAALLLGVVSGLSGRHLLPALWQALRPLLILIVLFGLIIVITTPGHAIARFSIVVATRDGVVLAIRLGLQALLIVFTTSLLTLTTPPLAVADAMEWALGSLEKVRVPIRDVIAMVSIRLTFVPLLIEEVQKVIAAQRARGANLGLNALLEEESMAALLIPVLLANLRRGHDLAESMDARLYATGPRTMMNERRFGKIDAMAGFVVMVGMTSVVTLTFAPR